MKSISIVTEYYSVFALYVRTKVRDIITYKSSHCMPSRMKAIWLDEGEPLNSYCERSQSTTWRVTYVLYFTMICFNILLKALLSLAVSHSLQLSLSHALFFIVITLP